MSVEETKELASRFSKHLFWDIDVNRLDFEKNSSQIVQRVLEYGELSDWHQLLSCYTLNQIVACCQQMRTLDPRALSFICCISHTAKESYRCYNFASRRV